jgi:hypothetical protein
VKLENCHLAFRPVDDGLVEGDRIADAGIQKLVVIGIVSRVASIDIRIHAYPVKKAFRETAFVIIAPRWLNRQAKKLIAERINLGGT